MGVAAAKLAMHRRERGAIIDNIIAVKPACGLEQRIIAKLMVDLVKAPPSRTKFLFPHPSPKDTEKKIHSP